MNVHLEPARTSNFSVAGLEHSNLWLSARTRSSCVLQTSYRKPDIAERNDIKLNVSLFLLFNVRKCNHRFKHLSSYPN